MILEPVDVLMKTSELLVPTSTNAPVSPLPTVAPDQPNFQHVSKHGVRTLWVGFVIMLIASVAFIAMSWRVAVSKRIFHSLTSLLTIIATLSYFAMATGGGSTRHHTLHHHHNKHVPDTHTHVFRQVFWAHYVDWFLTTPLIVLNLGFLSGLSGGHIFQSIVSTFILNLAALFSTLGHQGRGSKWGWFAIACIAYLSIVWNLLGNGRASARARNNKVSRFYNSITGFSLLVWTVFPIIWAISGGKRILSVDNEIIAYLVLDILAKVVFGAWLLITLSSTPEAHVELTGFWSSGASPEGRLRIGDDQNGA